MSNRSICEIDPNVIYFVILLLRILLYRNLYLRQVCVSAMQSLISPVDHESRTSSHRGGESIGQGSSEESPLIYRFPRETNNSNLSTILVVSALMAILLGGFVIGIYLLVLQNNAENILPPVEHEFQFIPRSQWDTTIYPTSLRSTKAKSVVLQQTDTDQCNDMLSCIEIIREIQASLDGNKTFPYNFMVASDGTIYEGLGWLRHSPLYPQLPALVVSFIGNFTVAAPSEEQINSTKNFIKVAVDRNYLVKNYTIIGKTTTQLPQNLFKNFESLPEWDEGLSDY